MAGALPKYVRIDRGVVTELNHWCNGVFCVASGVASLRKPGRAASSKMTTIPLGTWRRSPALDLCWGDTTRKTIIY